MSNIKGSKEQYYRPVCVSSCFFSFSVVPNPLQFLLKIFNLLVILLFIIFILDHESSGRVTHDSHKLQTKAINHSTRRYMNRRELQSDQPIHVPLLRVLSFPPSDEHCRHSRAARATPSNHTQRYASCNCSELRCYSNTLRRFRTVYEAVQVATRSADRQYTVYGLFGRAHCVG